MTWVKGKTREEVFNDYAAYVAKFNAAKAKTTDDTITPPEVYWEVLKWLGSKVNLDRREIVRPFYPGGDYITAEYPDRCVVVDNPPFSIRTKIMQFYTMMGIDFFLFSPAVTLLSSVDCTYIAVAEDVCFANGAVLPVSFVTSLFPEYRYMTAPDLKAALYQIRQNQKSASKLRRKVRHPGHILRSTDTLYDADFAVKNDECVFIHGADNYKNLYGGGLLLSDEARARADEARARAYEARARAYEARARADEARARAYELSEREKEIIKKLNST